MGEEGRLQCIGTLYLDLHQEAATNCMFSKKLYSIVHSIIEIHGAEGHHSGHGYPLPSMAIQV